MKKMVFEQEQCNIDALDHRPFSFDIYNENRVCNLVSFSIIKEVAMFLWNKVSKMTHYLTNLEKLENGSYREYLPMQSPYVRIGRNSNSIGCGHNMTGKLYV